MSVPTPTCDVDRGDPLNYVISRLENAIARLDHPVRMVAADYRDQLAEALQDRFGGPALTPQQVDDWLDRLGITAVWHASGAHGGSTGTGDVEAARIEPRRSGLTIWPADERQLRYFADPDET